MPGAVNIPYEMNWNDPATLLKLARKQVGDNRGMSLKDDEALKKELGDLLKAHFSLRMQIATQQLTNTSQLRKTRRDIARVRTVMNERAAAR